MSRTCCVGRHLRTRGIKLFVIDEADEMLNRGFVEQIDEIYCGCVAVWLYSLLLLLLRLLLHGSLYILLGMSYCL